MLEIFDWVLNYWVYPRVGLTNWAQKASSSLSFAMFTRLIMLGWNEKKEKRYHFAF
jgi:hypothetical protein